MECFCCNLCSIELQLLWFTLASPAQPRQSPPPSFLDATFMHLHHKFFNTLTLWSLTYWCVEVLNNLSNFHFSPVTLCYSDWDSNCLSCECKWSSGKKVANCTNAKLNSIPQNLHAEVQVLILDYNFISTLGENIFIRNLPNLQKISLRHCGIKTINEKAFNGLKILVEVDLSHNNITKA